MFPGIIRGVPAADQPVGGGFIDFQPGNPLPPGIEQLEPYPPEAQPFADVLLERTPLLERVKREKALILSNPLSLSQEQLQKLLVLQQNERNLNEVIRQAALSLGQALQDLLSRRYPPQ